MENICFAHPERFFLLLLLFPLAGVLGWGLRRKFHARKKLVDDKLSEHLLGGWEGGREIAVRMMHFLATGCVVIALCGPQLCSGEKMVRRDALDMVYLLDVSNSMLARDISPDRLERAREEIVRISRGIERGRKGLVAFAGSGVVQCPLTTDQQAFETMLSIALPDLIEAQGTDISAAFKVAQKMFSGSTTEANVKAGGVVVLVSDGEVHEKGFSAAVRKLKEKDVRLIVIGVGEEEPVTIPLGGDFSLQDPVKRDAQGEAVLTSFRPDLLVKLAEDAGGIFLHSRESGFVSEEALTTIATIDRGKQWITEPRHREDLFHYFVLLSVSLLLGAGVLQAKQ